MKGAQAAGGHSRAHPEDSRRRSSDLTCRGVYRNQDPDGVNAELGGPSGITKLVPFDREFLVAEFAPGPAGKPALSERGVVGVFETKSWVVLMDVLSTPLNAGDIND